MLSRKGKHFAGLCYAALCYAVLWCAMECCAVLCMLISDIDNMDSWISMLQLDESWHENTSKSCKTF